MDVLHQRRILQHELPIPKMDEVPRSAFFIPLSVFDRFIAVSAYQIGIVVDLKLILMDGNFVIAPKNGAYLFQWHFSSVRPEEQNCNSSADAEYDEDEEKLPSNLSFAILLALATLCILSRLRLTQVL